MKACNLTKPDEELARWKPFSYNDAFTIILYVPHSICPNMTKIATAKLKPTLMLIIYNRPV